MTLTIDCHGQYTTAPTAHKEWRDAQKAAFAADRAVPPYPAITDDALRDALEADQICLIGRFVDLVTGREKPVDLSGVPASSNGIELQDRAFVAAIREGREPNSAVAQVLPCYRVLDRLERQLDRMMVG